MFSDTIPNSNSTTRLLVMLFTTADDLAEFAHACGFKRRIRRSLSPSPARTPVRAAADAVGDKSPCCQAAHFLYSRYQHKADDYVPCTASSSQNY